MSVGPILFGSSVLVAALSLMYMRMESLFNLSAPSVQTNSIFSSILASLFPNDETPAIAVRHPFGLSSTRTVPGNHSIISFPVDFSPLIIDGVHNVPVQFASSAGFKSLSQEARTTISIAIYKTSNEEFTNALSLLWKGVGVRPIPDTRWARYRGVFSLSQTSTGIEEIDRQVTKAHSVMSECSAFLKQGSLQRIFRGLDEAELRWSWVFLNAYGVLLEGSKALVAPLVFARRSFDPTRAALVNTFQGTVSVSSSRKLDRGEEVLLYAADELTDAFAFLFHGSWVADESVHRGKVWLALAGDSREQLVKSGCLGRDGKTQVTLSTDAGEQAAARERLRKCSQISVNGHEITPAKEQRAVAKLIHAFEEELGRLQKQTSSDSALEAVRFQYFNLLYTEFVFWTEEQERIRSKTIDL